MAPEEEEHVLSEEAAGAAGEMIYVCVRVRVCVCVHAHATKYKIHAGAPACLLGKKKGQCAVCARECLCTCDFSSVSVHLHVCVVRDHNPSVCLQLRARMQCWEGADVEL